MGHSVITCGKCGNYIMEGRNDWYCDNCGWYMSCRQQPSKGNIKPSKDYSFTKEPQGQNFEVVEEESNEQSSTDIQTDTLEQSLSLLKQRQQALEDICKEQGWTDSKEFLQLKSIDWEIAGIRKELVRAWYGDEWV